MVMARPYSYERVLRESRKYPMTAPDGTVWVLWRLRHRITFGPPWST